MSKGYVYILTNPAMPDLVKIGKTTRSVAQRAHELNQTGVPLPFDVYYSQYVPDCTEAEALIHSALAGCRVSEAREFFRIDPPDAVDYLRSAAMEQVHELIEEFAPDFAIVETERFIDPSTVDIAAGKCGLEPYEMDWVFRELTADEMAPAAARVVAEVTARIERAAQARALDRAEQPGDFLQ